MRTAAIWTSHANAIEMLSLVAKPDISPLLYFAQDSVHVMIAYAAVFLVKVSHIQSAFSCPPVAQNPNRSHSLLAVTMCTERDTDRT